MQGKGGRKLAHCKVLNGLQRVMSIQQDEHTRNHQELFCHRMLVPTPLLSNACHSAKKIKVRSLDHSDLPPPPSLTTTKVAVRPGQALMTGKVGGGVGSGDPLPHLDMCDGPVIKPWTRGRTKKCGLTWSWSLDKPGFFFYHNMRKSCGPTGVQT